MFFKNIMALIIFSNVIDLTKQTAVKKYGSSGLVKGNGLPKCISNTNCIYYEV